MKVLMLGGAGYLGAQLLEELMKRSDVDEIVIYDNLSRSNYAVFIGDRFPNPERIRFIRGELLDSGWCPAR
jgi:UDP-glucose 4-epimerase